MNQALAELEQRALAISLLPAVKNHSITIREQHVRSRWKNPSSAQTDIASALALYIARKISLQMYIFSVAYIVEGVHEGRLFDNFYPEIVELFNNMRKIEKAYGLKTGEYWKTTNAPSDWLALSAKSDALGEKRLSQTFRELENYIATELFDQNRTEFNRLRERGRRSVFHKNELVPALIDTIKRYEIEAQAAASAKAYTAAVTLIGAALEGLLTLRCMQTPTKAKKFALTLPSKKRPKSETPFTKWSFDTLIEVCLCAGWLPAINTTTMSVNAAGLAHLIKQMRNNIHPGKVSTNTPWIEAEQRDFEDAEQIYAILFTTVFRSELLRRLLSVKERKAE